jgi:hypothetical protein
MKEAIKELIRSEERLQSELRTKLKEVNEHHENCNIAKTVGTGLNTIGTVVSTAGLVMAPFTGGLSLGLTLGGLGSTLGGITTNVVTGIVDGKATAQFAKEIDQICKAAMRAIDKLVEHYNAVRSRVDHLKAEEEALEELSNISDKVCQLILEGSFEECKRMIADVLPPPLLRDQALLRRIIETICRWTTALFVVEESERQKEVSEKPVDVRATLESLEWFHPRNKHLTIMKIIDLMKNAIKMAKKKWQEDKEEKKKKKRGDHVINDGVLSNYEDVLKDFMEEIGINWTSLETDPLLCDLREDAKNPLQSQRDHEFVDKTTVQFDQGFRPGPDINAFLFGVAIFVLKTMSVRHMKKMYYNWTSDWHRHGTTSTTAIKFICRSMNMCPILVMPQNEPIYVDEEAKNKWLSTREGNLAAFVSAKTRVHLVFEKHYEKLKYWVIRFRQIKPVH